MKKLKWPSYSLDVIEILWHDFKQAVRAYQLKSWLNQNNCRQIAPQIVLSDVTDPLPVITTFDWIQVQNNSIFCERTLNTAFFLVTFIYFLIYNFELSKTCKQKRLHNIIYFDT